jgi:hypothetical protein
MRGTSGAWSLEAVAVCGGLAFGADRFGLMHAILEFTVNRDVCVSSEHRDR